MISLSKGKVMNPVTNLSYGVVSVFVVLGVLAALREGAAYQCDVPDEWIISNVSSRNFHRGNMWPNGIVKYQLHRSLTTNDRQEVQRAFTDIQSKTCIRFQPRGPFEMAYTSIEVDERVCGVGHVCYTGFAQFAKFGKNCKSWNTMVHELGHNLCMGHEQTRSDRDEYLQFDNCTQKQIPKKDRNNVLRGSLYDYTSQMHYRCGWCAGGWPTQDEVTKCGHEVQDGLSVMDADKLNDLYNCGGCYAHRWRPINALTAQDTRNLVKFGTTQEDEPFYACRGVINGELCVGKYSTSSGICYLPYNGTEHKRTSNVQVFTSVYSGGSSYRLENIRDFRAGTVSGKPVRSGNTRDAEVGYIAVTNIFNNTKKMETAIGKVFEKDLDEAIFPILGGEVKTNDYWIVVCG